MATIHDVTRWQAERGVFHIVASRGQGYSHMLCRMFTTDNSQSEIPTGLGKRFKARICRKCRAALKSATVTTKPELTGAPE